MDDSSLPRISDITISYDDVYKVITKLSNGAAMGPDGLPVHVFKNGGEFIVSAILDITRDSMDTGHIPDIWRLGWITPLWKGSDFQDPVNYRPISLTAHMVKIIERLIRAQVTDYLMENNLIENSQHGSRCGRGTLTQLIRQHDIFLENMAKGNNIDITYLDFSKVFDLVDHSLLLRNMKEKGVRGKLLIWMRNFLLNRKQQVRVGKN